MRIIIVPTSPFFEECDRLFSKDGHSISHASHPCKTSPQPYQEVESPHLEPGWHLWWPQLAEYSGGNALTSETRSQKCHAFVHGSLGMLIVGTWPPYCEEAQAACGDEWRPSIYNPAEPLANSQDHPASHVNELFWKLILFSIVFLPLLMLWEADEISVLSPTKIPDSQAD